MLHIESIEDDVYKRAAIVSQECGNSMVQHLLSIIQDNVISSQATTAERRARLCGQINGIHTQDTLEAALSYHHEGTCTWALELDAFKQWKADDSKLTKLLWIHGPPGFGKTITSAWLVQYLKGTCQDSLSYFFCVADNERTRDPYAILRSWLVQILENDVEVTLDIMERTFTGRKEGGPLTHSELWKLFSAIVQARPGRFFLLDGFDECTNIAPVAGYHRNDPRGIFLRELVHHLPESKARVLVVSRDVADIREYLGEDSIYQRDGVTRLEYQITSKDTSQDVKSFSHHIVDQKLPKKGGKLRQKIAEVAADRSEGMFLWIQLLEKEISPGQNAKQLTATVQGMPSGISEAYARELERIDRLPSSDRAQAIMILRWVLFAVRPLRVKELAEALIVSDEDLDGYPEDDLPDEWQECFVNEDYVNDTILGSCGSLLRLRSESPHMALANHTVHFVHFSVKEYLTSQGNENPWSARLSLADTSMEMDALSRVCLRYLTLDVFGEVPTDTRLYPFLSYASWAWYFHSYHQRPPPHEDIMDITRRAFDPASLSWKVWTPVLERKLVEAAPHSSQLWEQSDDDASDVEDSTTSSSGEEVTSVQNAAPDELAETLHLENPIYYASLLGLTDVVDWLAGQGLRVDCVGGRYGFPLQAASAQDHGDAVAHLLTHGALVNQTGGEFKTALIAAAASATLETVQRLLDARANVILTDDEGLQAIDYAAKRGAADMVQALLAHGAQPTPTSRRLSCRFGHRNVLRLLMIGQGSFTPAQSSEDLLAISSAMMHAHSDVVIDIIDTLPEATVSAELTDGFTLLHHAAAFGALAVVQRLLHHPDEKRRAKVNQTNDRGWSALHEACSQGHRQMVLALLEAGADVSQGDLNTTALQAAASGGHGDIIKILLAHGAELDQKTRGSVTALCVAVEVGSTEGVKILLDQGASMQGIDEQNSLQQTLYETAVASGYEEIADLLLGQGCFGEAGCSPDNGTQPQHSRNLLFVVSREQDQEAFGQLETDLAEHHSTELLGETIRAAAYTGKASVVAHLLSMGVRSNGRDMNGRTALHYAATRGHEEICRLLLEAGAVIGIEDDNGSTAIDLAVRRGIRSASFIKSHMADLIKQIRRRPSLLTPDKGPVPSPSAVRKALAGHWEGEYEYLDWEKSRKDAWTLDLPPSSASACGGDGVPKGLLDVEGLTFDSSGADLEGDFTIHGFVDPAGCIWFVKLYATCGWLYKGKLSADMKQMRGTWGTNRKLWHGTFTLNIGPSKERC